MMVLFQHDARYVRFLAAHPGIWSEVGVFDDSRLLGRIRRLRARQGLPPVGPDGCVRSPAIVPTRRARCPQAEQVGA